MIKVIACGLKPIGHQGLLVVIKVISGKFLRRISYQGLLVVIKVRDKRSSNTIKVWYQARVG